jgi:peptidoglycan hydrolase-like protein with peptidoglycan-binding domain
MDWMTVMQLAFQWGPTIKSIIDEAATNEDIVTKITHLAPNVAGVLEQAGLEFFPQAAPQIHIAAAAIAAFDPNTTKWIQNACNSFVDPSPNLVVDGQYGPKTKAAVEALQAKLGLTVDGVAGMLTQAAISALLTKVPTV